MKVQIGFIVFMAVVFGYVGLSTGITGYGFAMNGGLFFSLLGVFVGYFVSDIFKKKWRKHINPK
ncbi:hypothetical protein [Terasakiella pusilla]|uniref:hypothetical protein n=1 Tax=Terasakiella pusilla TaxID=64973 RepID=UPI003AA8FB17